MSEIVRVSEVGPRDGLQMASVRMETGAKIAWIKSLAAAGVTESRLAASFPRG